MGKLKFDRIKKSMAILFVVFFVMSATAAAVSARSSHGYRSEGARYGTGEGARYGTGEGARYGTGDITVQVQIPTIAQTNVAVVTVIDFSKASPVSVNLDQSTEAYIRLHQYA